MPGAITVPGRDVEVGATVLLRFIVAVDDRDPPGVLLEDAAAATVLVAELTATVQGAPNIGWQPVPQ